MLSTWQAQQDGKLKVSRRTSPLILITTSLWSRYCCLHWVIWQHETIMVRILWWCWYWPDLAMIQCTHELPCTAPPSLPADTQSPLTPDHWQWTSTLGQHCEQLWVWWRSPAVHKQGARSPGRKRKLIVQLQKSAKYKYLLKFYAIAFKVIKDEL